MSVASSTSAVQLTVLGSDGIALGFVFAPVTTMLHELRKQVQKELKAPLTSSLPGGWLFQLNGVVVSKVQEKKFKVADIMEEERRSLRVAADPNGRVTAPMTAAVDKENENDLKNAEHESAKAAKEAERAEKEQAKAAAQAEKERVKAAKEAERLEKERAKAALQAAKEAERAEKERSKAAKDLERAEKERAKAQAQAEREAAQAEREAAQAEREAAKEAERAEKERAKAAKEAERAAALAEKEAVKAAKEAERAAKEEAVRVKAAAKAAKAAEPKPPKKPSLHYACYVAATQAALKEAEPSLTQPDVMKALGERWKAMGEEERARFAHDAEKDDARYRAEYVEYATACAAAGLAPVKQAPLPKAAQPKAMHSATTTAAVPYVVELESPAQPEAFGSNFCSPGGKADSTLRCHMHPCELVPTARLALGGVPRVSRATCDCCGVRSCAWTCEPCDFDLCERCGAAAFQINDAAIELEAPPTLPEEATPAEPEKVAAADTPTWLRTAASEVGICAPSLHEYDVDDNDEDEPEGEKDYAKYEGLDAFGQPMMIIVSRSMRKMNPSDARKVVAAAKARNASRIEADQMAWRARPTEGLDDASLREAREAEQAAKIGSEAFTHSIKSPPASCLKQSGKGFTVWSSCGYGNDGWHSYNPPPDKVFDSSFKQVADANARAKYLFYVKNPWGIDPVEELLERNEIDESFTGPKNDLLRLQVRPDDSETWTVGVVPDAAFAHLDKARMPNKWEIEQRDGCNHNDSMF